jgi:hypothetical protein
MINPIDVEIENLTELDPALVTEDELIEFFQNLEELI